MNKQVKKGCKVISSNGMEKGVELFCRAVGIPSVLLWLHYGVWALLSGSLNQTQADYSS